MTAVEPPDLDGAPSLADDAPPKSARTAKATAAAKKAAATRRAKREAEQRERAATEEAKRDVKSARDKPPKEPGRPSSDAKLRESVVQLYVFLGMASTMAGGQLGQIDGLLIGANADACADAWIELSRTSPAVRRALETLTRTGAWGGVISAHLPLVLAIAKNHGAQLGPMDALAAPLPSFAAPPPEPAAA